MYGEHHVEYLAANGEYRVWITNATREPIAGDINGSLKDGDTSVPLAPNGEPGLLVGHGDGAGTRPVTVELGVEGTAFSLSFNAATSNASAEHAH
jgi:hypothetical protein